MENARVTRLATFFLGSGSISPKGLLIPHHCTFQYIVYIWSSVGVRVWSRDTTGLLFRRLTYRLTLHLYLCLSFAAIRKYYKKGFAKAPVVFLQKLEFVLLTV